VHGPLDPYKRSGTFEGLKTRPNPRGRGVIVTAWIDSNRGGSADYSRTRVIWLVLNGRVSPITTEAAMTLGRLHDGLPASVEKQAGLVVSYVPGKTMPDQLGIEEYTHVRRFSGGNPFPQCR
jgi:hypothetical protein